MQHYIKGMKGYTIGFALAAAFYPILNFFLTWKSIDVQMIDSLGTPLECNYGIFGTYRSSTPSVNVKVYCGGVYTDFGIFAVVETDTFYPFTMQRSEILAMLHPGCNYRIWIYGGGSMPHPTARGTNRLNRTIFWAEETQACNSKG